MILSAKKLLFFACALIFCEADCQADSSGLFMSVSDYYNHQLSFPISCKSKRKPIKLHKYVARGYVTLRFHDSKYKFRKSAIFGYQNCDSQAFRFFLDDAYEILNTRGFWIYRPSR